MRLRNQTGFTAVEVLVAVSVTALVVMVISNFMMRSIQSSTLETTQANILREIQLTLDAVANDVRLSGNADQNNRNSDPNGPGGQFGWTSDADTLVLAKAAITSDRTIIFSDPSNYVTTKNNVVYFVTNGTLYKRTIAANVAGNSTKTTCPSNKVTSTCSEDRIMLRNVQQFNVTYLNGSSQSVSPTDARSVEIRLTAGHTQYRQTQSASYTTRMVFRND